MAAIPGFMVIKLASTILIFILQNHPIKALGDDLYIIFNEFLLHVQRKSHISPIL
jgi:hypothetical protein